MDNYWNRSDSAGVRDRSHQTRGERENPSFSSTLLDQIYRSIDGEDELVLYTETTRKKKHHSTTTSTLKNDQDVANFRRMEKKKVISSTSEKIIPHNKSAAADYRRKSLENGGDISSMLLNSSWSSSDSSSGFFSSEAESSFGVSSNSNYRPKPIRTNFSTQQPAAGTFQNHQLSEQKLKHQGGTGGFVKTKSKALKIYGNLKKVKQPISPGGRIASFLNSIFSSAGNAKKAKISSTEAEEERSLERKSKSAHASSCSSASSFSRSSCLSKTPSSNGTKRSVRFYPVTTVIVDADYQQSRGHKYNLQRDERNNLNSTEKHRLHIKEKNRRVEEAARDLLKNYHKKVECEMDDQEDDDAASYASSDLFELDNLNSAFERYREELPVYETTYFDTNRAIANGLIN